MNERGDSNPLAFLHTEPLDISCHLFLNTVEKCWLNACDLGSIWVLGTQWGQKHNGLCTYGTCYSLSGRGDKLETEGHMFQSKTPTAISARKEIYQVLWRYKKGDPIQSEYHEGFPKEVIVEVMFEEWEWVGSGNNSKKQQLLQQRFWFPGGMQCVLRVDGSYAVWI